MCAGCARRKAALIKLATTAVKPIKAVLRRVFEPVDQPRLGPQKRALRRVK
jgi:hypothetical protein